MPTFEKLGRHTHPLRKLFWLFKNAVKYYFLLQFMCIVFFKYYWVVRT